MDLRETAQIMEILQYGFPNLKPDEKMILAWASFLFPFDVRDVRRAAVTLGRGQDPDSDPSFPPTSAAVCRLAETYQIERFEIEDRERRKNAPKLEAETSGTRAASAAKGASIRERIAQGEALADILAKIGRPITGPPTTDAEMNTARNRALDEIESFRPEYDQPPPPSPSSNPGGTKSAQAGVR